ncbi:hypothetical protein A9Q98_08580 [Thalassotalea sp. 42_200_T64]|nr:hypothetical protein A9Q98_08580 [Thalassotalea sp. 42_200_T64]
MNLNKMILISLLSILAMFIGTSAKAEYADVVLNKYSEANDMRPVIFPHWFHRVRFRCKVCHSELGFEMRAGANDISMEKIMDGDYCGMCHNEEIAWGLDHCDRCHSGKPGLKSGIKGGHQTMGPSIW